MPGFRISSESMEIGKIIKTYRGHSIPDKHTSAKRRSRGRKPGAAGKGFAVVADEGKNLATKSSEAAKNISAS